MTVGLSASATYLALLGIAVVTSVVTAVASWRYYERTGGRAFGVLTGAVALWVLADLTGLLSRTLFQAMVAQRVTYFAISVVPVAWVVLAFRYVGRPGMVNRRRVVLMCLVPAATLLVSLTNDLHHLLWRVHGISQDGVMTTVVSTSGPWFWVHTLYSYGLLAVGAGVFVNWSLRTRDAYRSQSVAVLAAVALPWAANVAYVTGLVSVPADVTPLVFPVTCVLLWIGLFHYRFLDVVPVARDRVVEEMREGVVVLDDRDKVVDANPAARRLLRPDEIVGRHMDSVFNAESVDRFGDVVEGRGRIAVDREDGTWHFEVRISPLSVDAGERVVIFHDVTEEERHRERLAEQTAELERQNERLDRFASVLSHDLRNPLAVARGWTDVLAEDEVNEDALERVHNAHDRIDTIVDDTLALARSGTDPELEPVALDELARRAWESVESGGRVEPGGRLDVDAGVVVMADPDRTMRLFENLFRNAVEHAGSDVEVTVGLLDGREDPHADGELDGGSVGFFVADDGPGVDEDDRDAVFEYGVSGDGGGTGLGLAIVRDVAEEHGWTVDLESTESGGARFAVRGLVPAERETPL
ncbi:PAS domain-containing protein [Halorarum halophilum]|uniref:histidine kinase n=1 Tax=Halorarum halophilum TaxID=2743090 RepID=A0A7D5GAL1_9EURY|nr:histidine kinase N-terminal 7TM domain-containing protein [Halobaculum halophilum]QLG26672.1 PAS domain-containing protein [Halobaculum halophilum]